MADVSRFNLLGDIINVKDNFTERRFVLLGDSNSTPASYNSNFTALSNLNTYLSGAQKRTSVSKFSPVSGMGFTTSPNNFESQLSPDDEVTDVVVVGGGNDVSQEQDTIQNAIGSFLDACISNYPKIKRVFFIWIACRINRQYWLKQKIIDCWTNSAVTYNNISVIINDISDLASNVNMSLSVDDLHYNIYGQYQMFPKLLATVMGFPYDKKLPPIFEHVTYSGANVLYTNDSNMTPLSTQPVESMVTWYPDGHVDVTLTFSQIPTVQSCILQLPAHYAGLANNYQYAMPIGTLRDITSDTNYTFGVYLNRIDRQNMQILMFLNTISVMSVSNSWRLFATVPGFNG